MKQLLYSCIFLIACQIQAQQSDFKHIDFRKADSLALAYKGTDLYDLQELTNNLSTGLTTDVERFRAIYMWVCTNIKNDYNLYLKNKRKRQRFKADSLKTQNWNNRLKKDVFRKLIKDKKTICTGYAFMVQQLASLANIPCEIVHGYGKTSTNLLHESDMPNHTWNAVKLNDKWYLCDPTWASGIQNAETLTFTFDYNDGYFLTNPELFVLNHYPMDTKWLLFEGTTPAFRDFLEAPLLYGNAYKTLETHHAPKRFHNTVKKHETVSFTYQLQKPVSDNTISLIIDNGTSDRHVSPTTKIINQNLTLEYQFNAVGFYDVHLMIGEEYISTYTFEVKG
ncbi:transglutaminase domain-containing protein [Hanstruepera ponticola]|uniref:transglutaminase domain-containing protein n=1 Tax=Hanstruepera ponticola TaxID=2042995 RepID=UPI00178737F4|nr:transglutaminase domain-containing protein [Hanstruepera ponticola]